MYDEDEEGMDKLQEKWHEEYINRQKCCSKKFVRFLHYLSHITHLKDMSE